MGHESGDDICETVQVPGLIDRIVTTTRRNPRTVNSISFYSGDWAAEYVSLTHSNAERNLEEWNFTWDAPVIGMYGMVNNDNNRITQLGWIMLDIYC